MSFNIDEYVSVDERITAFYEKYPDGRLTTVDWDIKPDLDGKSFVWVHAKAYRTPDDPLPGDGIAWYPVPGASMMRDSELMKAQTAAIGRAIVMLGFATKIASKDEVENARNGRAVSSQRGDGSDERATVEATSASGGLVQAPRDPQQMLVPFGKHKGKKVSDVPTAYWEWWLAQDGNKNPEVLAAVELHLGLVGIEVDHSADIDEIPF